MPRLAAEMVCIDCAEEQCAWLRQVWRLKRGVQGSWAHCALDFVPKTCCVVLRRTWVTLEEGNYVRRLCVWHRNKSMCERFRSNTLNFCLEGND